MIRKQTSFISDMEKVLVVWIEDQTSNNIPLRQNLIQSKALVFLNFMKAKKSEETAKENFEASWVCFMRF